MNIVREKAIYMAGVGHQGQCYGEELYFSHLSAVDQVLRDAGVGKEHVLRSAAWVHDVLEDTPIIVEALIKELGAEVAGLVDGVTNEPGLNRKERAIKTYPKIAQSKYRVALKLADRIANIEHSLRTDSKLGEMYLKEDEFFQKSLDVFNLETTETPIVPPLVYLWRRYRAAIADTRTKLETV